MMDNGTTPSVFSEIASQGFTVSSFFGASAAAYQLNLPESPSLINFAPSTVRGTSLSGCHEDPGPHQEELSDAAPEDTNFGDEKFRRLCRAHKDQAGPWITYRFNMRRWNPPKPHPEKDESPTLETPESFDGVLTKSLVAPNLSRLERSPEFHHYAYTKCVLVNKKLTNIDVLQAYSYLQYLDVSSNKLTSLKPLKALPFLKILDASYNLLTMILDFEAPFFLTVVNLSHNNIKQMRDLSAFWSVTDLDLSHNLIQTIDGINSLKYLSSLNLSFNRIHTLENLAALRINYLYLQNNMIKVHECSESANLHTLKNLRIINLSYNQISSLKILEKVENLEFLDIVNNNVSQLLDIYYLRKLKYLNKLNLTGNPVTTIEGYLEVCLRYIKNLTLLDNHPIDADSWLAKLSNEAVDVEQVAARNRLKLTVLEQLQLPQLWFWLPAFDSPPIAVIILVGLQANRRPYLARKFYENQKNVVLGIAHTTHPKPSHEAEGEHFHYVDEPEFIKMLKEGKFSAYQEVLGSYYGIAYSEFEKAKNGVIIFHTDLTMALAVKRIFFNTILVLTLPTSKEAHFEKLNIMYSVQINEDGTFKVVNSPTKSEYQMEIPLKEKSMSTSTQVHEVLDEIVDQVWKSSKKCGSVEQVHCADENELKEISTATSRKTSVDASGKSEKSEIFQLWWSKDPTTTMSIIIHPAHLSEEKYQMPVLLDSHDADSQQFKVNNEETANDQIKRYVSFTVAHVHTFSESSKSEIQVEQQPEDNGKLSDNTPDDSVPELKGRLGNFTKSDVRTSQAYTTCPLVTKNGIRDGKCYANLLIRDEGIRALFEEELRRRDELLELHLDMPGFFRELLCTDEEAEALNKLKTLLMDINRYDSTPKTILNVENDPIFADMIHTKVKSCFGELKKAVFISEKQAGEYTVKKYPHHCEQSACTNPSCPQWH